MCTEVRFPININGAMKLLVVNDVDNSTMVDS